ncbi:MAG: hypothetical protein OXU79_14975 [Gemmatimonadota bacterium]|nr:hypothetical protein [Gemmatimonadota bacterium]
MTRLFFIVAVTLSGLFSCSGDDDVPLDAPDSSGQFTRTLSHNGVTRTYILYVPDSYDETSNVPLMLNFHGFGQMADRYLRFADMRSLADSGSFILVYPQGILLDGNPHWNAGLESDTNKSDADDFGFVEALIDEIASSYRIDPARVYSCGFSNGAFFTYALACYRSDRIAAIGSVAGTMMEETFNNCSPSHPTAMINIHGTSDAVVPYAGTVGLKSIDDVLDYWTDFNNAGATPTVNRITDGATTIERHSYTDGNKDTSVEHYKVVNGGHAWFDISYEGDNTSALIWNFVSRYDIEGLRQSTGAHETSATEAKLAHGN